MPDRPGEPDVNPGAHASADDHQGADLRRAGVIHDVKQMLAVIRGRAELLQQREGPGEDAADLAAIALAAGDAGAMLDRLKGKASPLEEGATASLRDAAAEAALMIRPGSADDWAVPGDSVPDGSWILDVDIPADLHALIPVQVLREVLSNLLLNALEALPGGGKIRMAGHSFGPSVILTVSDDGPGLDKSAAGRIFEPGFTSSGRSGRGIGLAGSRQLLEDRGGTLTLGPDQNPGAQFVLDLPRTEPVVAEAGSAMENGETGGRSFDLPVLVVDDEPAVRDMLEDVLGELGCTVTTVGDAPRALAAFVPGAFALAWVDQSLPGLSGLELATRLREQDPCLVVVVFSGWGQEEVLAGADPDVVDMTATKPLAWSRLKEILDQGGRLYRRRCNPGSA